MRPQPSVSQLKRHQLIAMLAIVLIAAVTSCHRNATGGELELTGATDPGANAFMPPAASPPPTNTQPPPTLQPQGDGNTLATQPLPGDRDGLYGGTVNTPEVDREKIINFFGANPTQASAFVESLNTDNTLYWWGDRHTVTVADIPTYLRQLTPAVLRLDTRITHHGFDGAHPTTVQSVFEAGTAVLVDQHGIPRVRGLSGSPITAPIALKGEPKVVGTAWPGYRPGALAEVRPTTVPIGNFVLVDVVTGQPFNRPAGTTGAGDIPHTQPVAPPQPDSGTPSTSTPPTKGRALLDDIDGSYLQHFLTWSCGTSGGDATITITHQGNVLTLVDSYHNANTGTLNADGSFTVTNPNYPVRFGGVFATEGGRTVIRDGTNQGWACTGTWTATKQ